MRRDQTAEHVICPPLNSRVPSRASRSRESATNARAWPFAARSFRQIFARRALKPRGETALHLAQLWLRAAAGHRRRQWILILRAALSRCKRAKGVGPCEPDPPAIARTGRSNRASGRVEAAQETAATWPESRGLRPGTVRMAAVALAPPSHRSSADGSRPLRACAALSLPSSFPHPPVQLGSSCPVKSGRSERLQCVGAGLNTFSEPPIGRYRLSLSSTGWNRVAVSDGSPPGGLPRSDQQRRDPQPGDHPM